MERHRPGGTTFGVWQLAATFNKGACSRRYGDGVLVARVGTQASLLNESVSKLTHSREWLVWCERTEWQVIDAP